MNSYEELIGKYVRVNPITIGFIASIKSAPKDLTSVTYRGQTVYFPRHANFEDILVTIIHLYVFVHGKWIREPHQEWDMTKTIDTIRNIEVLDMFESVHMKLKIEGSLND